MCNLGHVGLPTASNTELWHSIVALWVEQQQGKCAVGKMVT